MRRIYGYFDVESLTCDLIAALRRVAHSAYLVAVVVRLSGSHDPSLQRVARAARRAVSGRFEPGERLWMERIEARRAELLAAHDVLFDDASHPGDGGERVADAVAVSSVTPHWGRFLFLLVRELRPDSCIELGAAVGISGAYQGAALEVNSRGRLLTIEGSLGRGRVAAETVAMLGIDRVVLRQGRFEDVLLPSLVELAAINYAFVDGHHERDATTGYVDLILGHAAEGAVIVLDDIRWSEGMREAWSQIRRDPRLGHAIRVGRIGVCVTNSLSGAALRFATSSE